MKNTNTKAEAAPAQVGGHTPGRWIVLRLEGRTSYKLFNQVCSERAAEANRLLIASAPALLAERDALKELLLATQRTAIAVAEERDRLKVVLMNCITTVPDFDITKHRARLAEINGLARAALAEGGSK